MTSPLGSLLGQVNVVSPFRSRHVLEQGELMEWREIDSLSATTAKQWYVKQGKLTEEAGFR